MRKKSAHRGILIVAGLLAAVIIVFSHSISFNHTVSKKATTEKSDEKSEKKTVLQAPAEAVVQGNTVQIDEQVPGSLIEVISEKENDNQLLPPAEKIVSKLFSVLFEVVLAPNAP